MSLVDVKGVNLVPGVMGRFIAAPGVWNSTMDDDGELCGAVIEIPRTGNISKIGFRTGNIMTTSDALKVSLQTVDDTTGRPTGTLIHADAYGVQASVVNNTTYWVSTQNPIAVTRGDIVAPVAEFNSYVAGNLQIIRGITNLSSADFPYIFEYLGGAWESSYRMPNFGLEYDDGLIEPIVNVLPAVSVSYILWNANDNPDRRGLRFSLPYNCRLSGVFAIIDLRDDTDFEIYDNDGTTLLETISMDANIRQGATTRFLAKNLITPVELTKDTLYRIILHPTTGTDIRIDSINVSDDGANKAMNAIDGGVNFHGTYCNGVPTAEGDWTQELTKRYLIGLMIDQLDDGLPYNIVSGAIITGQDTVGTITGV